MSGNSCWHVLSISIETNPSSIQCINMNLNPNDPPLHAIATCQRKPTPLVCYLSLDRTTASDNNDKQKLPKSKAGRMKYAVRSEGAHENPPASSTTRR